MLHISENLFVTNDDENTPVIGYDGENLARTLVISGTVHTSAVYYLETKGKNGTLYWSLTVDENGLSLPVTSALLTDAGFYMSQISKHSTGDVVMKSNVFLLEVKSSVNAVDSAEPVEPTAFQTQIDQMAGYLEDCEEIVAESRLDLSAEETARTNADDALDRRVTYLEEHGGSTSGVVSVNGHNGIVVLTASDVGASPSNHTHDDRYYTESEVNTLLSAKQGTLTDSDKQAIADLHSDAVTSVNGQTGAVSLTIPSAYDDTAVRGLIAGKQDSLSETQISDINDVPNLKSALAEKLSEDDVTQVLSSGTEIAMIGDTSIFAPAGGGGGATPVKKVSRTLTEAVTDLQITTDDNGNTLNISHWKALVYLPNSSSYTGNIIMYPCPYPFPDFSFRPSSNDGSAVNTMFAESVGDEFITFGYGIYGNSSDTYALKNIKYRNSSVNMTMTKFQLVTWTSGNAIPVGTKVEIWDLGW